MGLEDKKWQRNSSLKEMTDSYNGLVDEMMQMSEELSGIAQTVSTQHAEMADKFHELNDKILTVNYKTDEMKQDISNKLDDILRSVRQHHPGE